MALFRLSNSTVLTSQHILAQVGAGLLLRVSLEESSVQCITSLITCFI